MTADALLGLRFDTKLLANLYKPNPDHQECADEEASITEYLQSNIASCFQQRSCDGIAEQETD